MALLRLWPEVRLQAWADACCELKKRQRRDTWSETVYKFVYILTTKGFSGERISDILRTEPHCIREYLKKARLALREAEGLETKNDVGKYMRAAKLKNKLIGVDIATEMMVMEQEEGGA